MILDNAEKFNYKHSYKNGKKWFGRNPYIE